MSLALIGGGADEEEEEGVEGSARLPVPIIDLDIGREESLAQPLEVSAGVDYALSVTVHHETIPQQVRQC